jgi:hypothetical protein
MGCCGSKSCKENPELAPNPVEQQVNISSQMEESKSRTGDSQTGSMISENMDSKILSAQTTSPTGSKLDLSFNGSGVESLSGSKLE